MSQAESTTAKVPASVWVAKPVPIEEAADDMGEVSERIRTGRAFLKVVAFPWGAEFDVCDAGEEP